MRIMAMVLNNGRDMTMGDRLWVHYYATRIAAAMMHAVKDHEQ